MSMSRNRCRIRILANAIYVTHASYDAGVTFDKMSRAESAEDT